MSQPTTSTPVTLPSLDELARSPSSSLTAPAASLAELFERVAVAATEQLIREMALFPEVVYGAGVTCSIAVVAGVARLMGFSPVALFVISCVVGTIYGVVRVGLGSTRFVDKRTGQDVTVAVPLSFGFGFGLLAFGVEAVLALTPVPSVVLTFVLALTLLGVWFFRYRPRSHALLVPHLGTTRALLQLADPAAAASVTWNDPGAPPGDGLQYRASVTRTDGSRVTCESYLTPQGEALLVTADFPPSYRWRHPTERITLDGLTLECRADAERVHVRTTNTHARASGRLLLLALSMTANACVSEAHAPASPLPTYGA